MKVFAVIALLALVAYASAEDPPKDLEFVGELIKPNGEKVNFGEPLLSLPPTTMLWGIPSCKLGPKIGNPICFGKCVSRGHAGGSCDGKTCKCVD